MNSRQRSDTQDKANDEPFGFENYEQIFTDICIGRRRAITPIGFTLGEFGQRAVQIAAGACRNQAFVLSHILKTLPSKTYPCNEPSRIDHTSRRTSAGKSN